MTATQLKPVHVGVFCFLLGLIAAITAAIAQRHTNEYLVNQRFEALSRNVVDSVALRMRNFEYGLRGMRGIVVAVGGLPHLDQVQRYARSRDVDREFLGARGFGIIWRVPEKEEVDHVAHMRAEGYPDFTVRQISPRGGDRYVISFIEPQSRNKAALGLDIASEARRQAAAVAAAVTGKTSISEPITLVQASGKTSRSFLVLLPISRQTSEGIDADTVSSVLGWSYAPIVIDDVLAMLHLPEKLIWLELRDADSARDARFYVSEDAVSGDADLPASQVRFPLFNRVWIAQLKARPALVEELRLTSPYLIGAGGILTAALLGVVAFLLAQRRLRNRALLLERAERAAIVDASDDGIVGIRLDGTITEWNRGAERLFGFGAQEVQGRSIREVLPPAWLDEHAAILAGARTGKPVAAFETRRRHRNGELIDVSVSAVPIHDDTGRLISVAKTFRDIRPAKAAQRELEALNASLDSQVRERTAAMDRALHDLRNIVDALPSMIGYWDSNRRNRMANLAYARWFGVEPADLLGKDIRDVLGTQLYESNRSRIEAALRGETQIFERSIARPDGAGERYSLAHYLPDVIDGSVQGFYVLVHDVSELHEQRTALEAEKRDKAALLATIDAHAIVSVTDQEGLITTVNERFCRISGYADHEVLALTHRVVNSGFHPCSFWQTMWQAIREGATWQGEICNRAKDGTLYWIDSVIAPFMDAQGRIDKIISFSTDITARKRAELELRRTLATLESVLHSAKQVSIVATDLEGAVTIFNRGAELLTGYESAEIVGKLPTIHWHVREELAVRAGELGGKSGRAITLETVLTDDSALDAPFDCHYVRKDGAQIPVALSVARIVDADGIALGFIHIAHDIRNRLAQELALKKAASAAQQASQAKSRFLANMSHEIRTPLNAVIGLAYLLGRTDLDEEQCSYVTNIAAAGDTLLSIVSDVLDLSKIEAGEMSLEHLTFSLRDLCSDLHAMLGAQARSKGLHIRMLPDAALPDALRGDPIRLRQVLVNLLGNALKFTDKGSVELNITVIDMNMASCRLRFAVRDTGIGIEAASLGRLFMPFAQADASTTRRFGGTGLGLSIVKNVVEMMGGSIEVQSREGAGSCFMVELPFELGDVKTLLPKRKRKRMKPRLPGMRILLVDDSEINLTVAGRVLELENALVTKADNGAEAIRIVSEQPDFQAILMDIQMPVMDGIAAAREILRMGLSPCPYIVALTAGNTETERRLALDAGFRDVLSKPVDPECLIESLRSVLGSTDESVGERVTSLWSEIDGIDGHEARVRFGDDEGMFLRMLERLLDDCDAVVKMPVETAEDRAALARRAHKLKGSAATLAAHTIAAAAVRMEDACRRADNDGIRSAVEAIGHQGSRVRRAMPIS